MKVLKNAPFDNKPTIVITEDDSNWEEAHANWIVGKPPTNSPEWKKGVFFAIK